MSIAAPEPKANMGEPVPRYDAVAKVTGKAAMPPTCRSTIRLSPIW